MKWHSTSIVERHRVERIKESVQYLGCSGTGHARADRDDSDAHCVKLYIGIIGSLGDAEMHSTLLCVPN